MKNHLSIEHKKLFEEIKKSLTDIGIRESNFIRVELLFFKAMSVAREYGDNVADNGLLAAFKQLQVNQYQQANLLFNKSVQRERAIRRFVSSLKTVLSAGMKNAFYQPQLT